MKDPTCAIFLPLAKLWVNRRDSKIVLPVEDE